MLQYANNKLIRIISTTKIHAYMKPLTHLERKWVVGFTAYLCALGWYNFMADRLVTLGPVKRRTTSSAKVGDIPLYIENTPPKYCFFLNITSVDNV